MDRLPDDVLLIIFELLSLQDAVNGCARVCRRWRALVMRYSVRVRGFQESNDRLTHRTRRVLALPLHRDFRWVMQDVYAKSPMLTTLTVHALTPFSSVELDDLQYLEHLRHLDVFSKTHMLDWRVGPLAARLYTLVLNNTAGRGLFEVLAASRTLRSFQIYGRGLEWPPEGVRLLATVSRVQLTDLTLRCRHLEDDLYEAIGACENLASLRLYTCSQLTGAGLQHVVRPPRLRQLHVTGAPLVTSAAMAALVAALPLLLDELVLSATCFGDEHTAGLVARVARLRVLELWAVPLSAGAAVQLAAALPELRSLDLDMRLSPGEVRRLCALPTLESLRWTPVEEEVEELEVPVEDVGSGRVRLTSATEWLGLRYVRKDGEGYRGRLYYYWTVDRLIDPQPPNYEPPGLQDADDFPF